MDMWKKSSSPPAYADVRGAGHASELTGYLNSVPTKDFVSVRVGPGGRKVPYIRGGHAVQLANDVFGHGNWCSEVRDQMIDDVEEPEKRAKRDYKVVATVVVRVTCQCSGCEAKKLPGYHEGIGVGDAVAGQKEVAVANAKKAAETDGLKRALRKFGQIFGSFMEDPEAMKVVQQSGRGQEKVEVFTKSKRRSCCDGMEERLGSDKAKSEEELSFLVVDGGDSEFG